MEKIHDMLVKFCETLERAKEFLKWAKSGEELECVGIAGLGLASCLAELVGAEQELRNYVNALQDVNALPARQLLELELELKDFEPALAGMLPSKA